MCVAWPRERCLEEEFGIGFTDDIINRSTRSLKEVKKMLHGQDKKRLLERCREKASQIAVVAESIGWSKLWDMASDLGWKAVMGLQMLSRAMGHHGRGNHPCHLCNDEDGPLQISLGSDMDTERLMNMLSSSQPEVLSKYMLIAVSGRRARARCAYIYARARLTLTAMSIYICTQYEQVPTAPSCQAKQDCGVNPYLLSSNKSRPHLSTYITTQKWQEGAVLMCE